MSNALTTAKFLKRIYNWHESINPIHIIDGIRLTAITEALLARAIETGEAANLSLETIMSIANSYECSYVDRSEIEPLLLQAQITHAHCMKAQGDVFTGAQLSILSFFGATRLVEYGYNYSLKKLFEKVEETNKASILCSEHARKLVEMEMEFRDRADKSPK